MVESVVRNHGDTQQYFLTVEIFRQRRFLQRRKFYFRCITYEFGVFRMCKYFFYNLSCFPGWSLGWWCPEFTDKPFWKNRVVGLEIVRYFSWRPWFFFADPRGVSWYLLEFFWMTVSSSLRTITGKSFTQNCANDEDENFEGETAEIFWPKWFFLQKHFKSCNLTTAIFKKWWFSSC